MVWGEVSITEYASGPIPPARDLAAYDAVVPGTARAIVDAWREENAHRRKLESRQLSAGISAQPRQPRHRPARLAPLPRLAPVAGLTLSRLVSIPTSCD